MLKFILLISISLLFNTAMASTFNAVHVEKIHRHINFLNDVKPILDKRCVTCHSCYNSPCQAKFSSFEGIDRGGSKRKVYDTHRLKAVEPTRLFIDAQSTQAWRDMDFFSLTQGQRFSSAHNNSIMIRMLAEKKLNPDIVGSYEPERDKLLCPKNNLQLNDYFQEKPNHAMPYGLPEITDEEYSILTNWLEQGAKGPDVNEQKKWTTASSHNAKQIKIWEDFFNNKEAKYVMTARYLYEHLYIAHVNFTSSPNEFFQLVRSYTPAPEAIKVIPTSRPFDDPGVESFYYRLQKIHSTIVHKTHIIFSLDADKLKRMKSLFIEPEWLEKPHVMSYDKKISTNPFLSFAQIPARSKYEFLLDNAHYILMTFIRGPVCRGSMALNVINDHFWLMFTDPEYDLSVRYPQFLINQADNLAVPIENTNAAALEMLSKKFQKKQNKYYQAKVNFYNNIYPQGMPIESIWKGNKASDAPLLTIYRHYDSASVHKGVLGEMPRSLWVLDYPQLERVYYTLVAGFDVFGSVAHQIGIRRYTDHLRQEAEQNFLLYLPKDKRLDLFKSWYIGNKKIQKLPSIAIEKHGEALTFNTVYPKQEFIQKIVDDYLPKKMAIHFDEINYLHIGEQSPEIPESIKNKEDIITALRSFSAPGTEFIQYLSDQELNNIFIRIQLADKSYYVTYLLINRWHDNVSTIFKETRRFNPEKDTIDFLPMSAGSYPSIYVDVQYQDLDDFFATIKNYDASVADKNKLHKYLVNRADKDFWQIHDWFQDYFNQQEPVQSGLYDLNRYYRYAW